LAAIKKFKLISSTIIIGAIVIFLLSTSFFVKADSIALYFDWSLEQNSDVGGHLTLSGFPSVMDVNQTYKIEITLTLEYGMNLNLGFLNFSLDLANSEDQTLHLGYCGINSTLNKADSVSLISIWTINSTFNQTEGILKINSSQGYFMTSPKEIKVKLRLGNSLTLTELPTNVHRGDEALIKGKWEPVDNETLKYASQWVSISLTYLTPNGTEIVRRTGIDESGFFSDRIKPDYEGTWKVKASWNGTERYAPTFSSVETFEVQPPIPWYLFVAAIVVTIYVIWIVIAFTINKIFPREEQIY
jgi:hypothetical protein